MSDILAKIHFRVFHRTLGLPNRMLDRARQAMARDGTDNITVVALTLRKAF